MAEGRARYERSSRAFVDALLALEAKGVGPEIVAETVYRAMTAPSPRPRYPVGPKSRLLPLLFAGLPGGVADALRLRLFGVASS